MPKRTYIDTNVVIAAFRGQGEIGQQAFKILDDPSRTRVVSKAVLLETYPKAQYERRLRELEFYDAALASAEVVGWNTNTLCRAHDVAQSYGIDALDSIHVATAIDAKVDELITAEKPSKPMFRVKDLEIKTIRSANPAQSTIKATVTI